MIVEDHPRRPGPGRRRPPGTAATACLVELIIGTKAIGSRSRWPSARPSGSSLSRMPQDDQALARPDLDRVVDHPGPIVGDDLGPGQGRQPQPQQPEPTGGPMRGQVVATGRRAESNPGRSAAHRNEAPQSSTSARNHEHHPHGILLAAGRRRVLLGVKFSGPGPAVRFFLILRLGDPGRASSAISASRAATSVGRPARPGPATARGCLVRSAMLVLGVDVRSGRKQDVDRSPDSVRPEEVNRRDRSAR